MMSNMKAILFLFLTFQLSLPAEARLQDCDYHLTLDSSGLTLGAYRYDLITPEIFGKNMELNLRQAKKKLFAIRNSNQPPTFSNTIEALEYVSSELDNTLTVLQRYGDLLNNDALDALQSRFIPQISTFNDSILFDVKIFRRVEKLYLKRDQLNLNAVEMRLLENTYKFFIRGGINLDAAKKKQISAINVRMGLLERTFDNNLLSEAKDYTFIIKDPKNLDGLTEDSIKTAAEKAKEKGLEGVWLFTLSEPDYLAIIDNANNREIRKQYWMTAGREGQTGKYDNRLILLEIAKLRSQYAKILNYNTYADLTLELKMAKNVSTVKNFLKKLGDAYLPAAKKDIEELEAFAGHKIEPWDTRYYSLKLKEKKYSYNAEQVSAYFPLNQVLQSAFYTAENLYNIRFIERADLPTWHKDVKAYEVRDQKNNYVALFYFDPYPREGTKCTGAYCSVMRASGVFDGKMLRPHVMNILNMPLPTDDKPALLKLRDAETVFHELGHGLHQILSESLYPSMGGTRVARDGVELPSQINEKWLFAEENLIRFAKHYLTGEVLPQDIIDKIFAAKKFQVGLSGLTQVQRGVIDMAWYSEDLSKLQTADDVNAFENKILENLILIPRHGSLFSPGFSHIFSGGYAAGYYGYKWADNLVENFLAVFTKNGMYDQATAKKYQDLILSKGGTVDFDVLVRSFLGHDPDPNALLRSEGLIP